MKNKPNGSVDRDGSYDDKQESEGDHFEIDILRIIKIKSRRVSSKVIIAILLVLLFVWLVIKL